MRVLLVGGKFLPERDPPSGRAGQEHQSRLHTRFECTCHQPDPRIGCAAGELDVHLRQGPTRIYAYQPVTDGHADLGAVRGADLQQLNGTWLEADAVQALAFQPRFHRHADGTGEVLVGRHTGLFPGHDENDPVVPWRTVREYRHQRRRTLRVGARRQQPGGLRRTGAFQLSASGRERSAGARAEIGGPDHVDEDMTGIGGLLVGDGHRVTPSVGGGRSSTGS